MFFPRVVACSIFCKNQGWMQFFLGKNGPKRWQGWPGMSQDDEWKSILDPQYGFHVYAAHVFSDVLASLAEPSVTDPIRDPIWNPLQDLIRLMTPNPTRLVKTRWLTVVQGFPSASMSWLFRLVPPLRRILFSHPNLVQIQKSIKLKSDAHPSFDTHKIKSAAYQM